MMNQSNLFRHLAVAAFACLMAASCSDVTDDSITLPDGKYPMTFTASVDGLTATRVTTDNTWTGKEVVAVRIGDVVKKYKADANGTLTDTDKESVIYWQNTTESYTISAWYPYSNAKPTTLTVKADQSREGYQASDYLETVSATVSFNNSALTFTHRTAKVVVTLQTGEGVTDLTGATVAFVNQTGVEGNGTEVTPKKEISTYTALLTPQQMLGKQFIKVTVGTDDAKRDYYYTPTGNNDANLEAGHQYNYTITVKKTGLAVAVTGNGTSWTDESITGTTDTDVTFQITAPTTGVTIEKTEDTATLTNNGNGSYTLSGGNTVTITATSTYIKSIKGLYDVAGDGTTYTLKSDLLIVEYSLADARVGDFYCKTADGTTGYLIPGDASLTTEQQVACIGIVYSTDVSRIGTAATQALKKKGVSTPHGLVMALTDASEGCRWGEYGKDENSNGSEGEPFKENTDKVYKMYKNVDGYGETHWIIDTYGRDGNTALKNTYTAFYHASLYGTAESSTGKYAAPSNTTGWFIPGMGQWWDILSNLGKIDLTNYRDDTDSYTYISGAAPIAVANMNRYLEKISGATPFSTDTWFWSSSEYSGDYACYVDFFSTGTLYLDYNSKYSSRGRVRCSFAF